MYDINIYKNKFKYRLKILLFTIFTCKLEVFLTSRHHEKHKNRKKQKHDAAMPASGLEPETSELKARCST